MAKTTEKRPRKPSIKKVERRIYFYRATSKRYKTDRQFFDPNEILASLAEDIKTSLVKRCMKKTGDDKEYCCWIDKPESGQLKNKYTVVFGSIRRSDLPQKIIGDELKPLELGRHSGLVEKIHIVFFPNNIIGADYNFYGPRMPKFAEYLKSKAAGNVPRDIRFDFLLRQDIMNKLEKIGEIRLFNLRVRASYIDQISKANQSLGKAFDLSRNLAQAEDVEIVLRTAPHTKGKLSQKVLKITKSLMKSKELHQNALNFNVRGLDKGTQKMIELDLLSDKLISIRSISPINPKSKALDSESAFTAINVAYRKLQSQLLQAAGAGAGRRP